ncbi:L-lactate permease [Ferrovibrio sp.]|uniref:L-lactate permease n=1 Tax=Ferrovibrio sp. TaxID=1917215 RepID=UPI0025C3C64B|nr:L-lactate permease [Ferrovibrio sp.]MBX3453061.1 L-lactate permease [Ferrovibrio sp.]
MTALIYLAPILLVTGLVLASRMPLLRAGAFGLLATLLAAYYGASDTASYLAMLPLELAKGVWLAWQGGSIVLFGLFLHLVLSGGNTKPTAGAAMAAAPIDPGKLHRHVFLYCFLAGPCVESAIGFGIGYAAAIGGLLRLGIPPLSAALLSIFCQMLVPWGALAVGTQIGASLAHVPLVDFGFYSSITSAPLVLVLLPWFWLLMHRQGIKPAPGDLLVEAGYLLGLIGLLILGNWLGAVEASGLVACALILGVMAWREGLMQAAPIRTVLAYGALALLLLGSRLIPGIAPLLNGIAVLRPFDSLPTFPLLYHAASILLLLAIADLLLRGETSRLPGLLRQTWQGARMPVAAMVVFLTIARIYTGTGMADALAQSWSANTGSAAAYGGPLFAMVMGALTGSTSAVNGLLLPIQSALAQAINAPELWVLGLQNSVAGAMTAIFPGKVAMACAFAGIPGQERLILRRYGGYALFTLLCSMGVLALVLP